MAPVLPNNGNQRAFGRNNRNDLANRGARSSTTFYISPVPFIPQPPNINNMTMNFQNPGNYSVLMDFNPCPESVRVAQEEALVAGRMFYFQQQPPPRQQGESGQAQQNNPNPYDGDEEDDPLSPLFRRRGPGTPFNHLGPGFSFSSTPQQVGSFGRTPPNGGGRRLDMLSPPPAFNSPPPPSYFRATDPNGPNTSPMSGMDVCGNKTV